MLRQNNSLIADSNPSSYVSESFRSLRTYIRHKGLLSGDRGAVLLFTSTESGEGKTTLLANLAVSFVQEGRKVAVIDCNLRSPGLHAVFGIEGSQGLAAYLSGSEEPGELAAYGTLANLSVIPAGRTKASPPDLLGGGSMAELLDGLRASHDLILLDTPPALEYTDARVLAPLSDGIILVARYGKAKRESLRKVKSLLEQAGANILGIAMNQAR